jgi:hypothetical protein
MITINDSENLIENIYKYEGIILWMDINNSMNKGFLKYVDINFPDLKKIEIKSGYGDTRKLGKVNEIKTKNMTFLICYVYKGREISLKLLDECSKVIEKTYNNSRLAFVPPCNENIFFDIFKTLNVDVTIYTKDIIDFNLYYYKKFLTLKTDYKNKLYTKEEYKNKKVLLEEEQKKGIYF